MISESYMESGCGVVTILYCLCVSYPRRTGVVEKMEERWGKRDSGIRWAICVWHKSQQSNLNRSFIWRQRLWNVTKYSVGVSLQPSNWGYICVCVPVRARAQLFILFYFILIAECVHMSLIANQIHPLGNGFICSESKALLWELQQSCGCQWICPPSVNASGYFHIFKPQKTTSKLI